MRLLSSLLAVAALAVIAYVGAVAGATTLLGVVIPYAAVALFVVGLVTKVIGWGRSAVPFRVPTTSGQQRSLPWIKHARFDNPSSGFGAAVRMLLEVVTFRSLFRNTKAELKPDGRIVYGDSKWLWAAAIAFHYSFLVILLRHFRFFAEPVPAWVALLGSLDGFFQVGVPVIYLTDVAIVAAVGYLLLRRLVDPRLRYISLAADYFPLFMLLSIAGTGIWLRYVSKVDVVAIKEMAIGLATFSPVVAQSVAPLFLVHLFLVSALFAYLPFSKLAHMAGVMLSPTRNLANSNRIRRHVNPWNPPLVGHTYAEWEEEFHDKLVAAGIPLDRE